MSQAWSHSSLTSYEQCPKRYFHLSVAKDVKEAPSEQLAWGSSVHKALENRLKKGKALPMGMAQFEPLVAPLCGLPGETLVEQKLALDEDLKPTGWFGEQVWVRVVIDAAFINGERALLLDWKTGKRKDGTDQLALMAAVIFAANESIQSVDSGFVWLGEPASRAVQRSSFHKQSTPELWGRFLNRVAAFQRAHERTDFPPNPGGLCRRYCPVTSCPYHGG